MSSKCTVYKLKGHSLDRIPLTTTWQCNQARWSRIHWSGGLSLTSVCISCDKFIVQIFSRKFGRSMSRRYKIAPLIPSPWAGCSTFVRCPPTPENFHLQHSQLLSSYRARAHTHRKTRPIASSSPMSIVHSRIDNRRRRREIISSVTNRLRSSHLIVL